MLFKTDNYLSHKLICFHHVGGSARVFTKWKKKLQNIDIIAVDMPERGSRQSMSFPKSVNEFVQIVAEELAPQLVGHNFVLYGHSFGALQAFMTASILEKSEKLYAKGLIVSGRHAPNYPDPSLYKAGMDREVLIKVIKDYQMTPDELLINEEFMAYYLPLIEKDYEWAEKFTYENDCLIEIPIIAHVYSKDIEATYDMMTLWRQMTKSNFSMMQFNGGHFYLFNNEEEYLSAMRKTLSILFQNC